MTSAEDAGVAMPRSYLRPCLLLLLAEGTSHGYELLAHLTGLGVGRSDPGAVYRCLRSMDEDGLVRSAWEPSTSGPARRVYDLTDDGRRQLDLLADAVAELTRLLTSFQDRHALLPVAAGAVR